MATIGAELADIAAGRVAISLAIAPRLSQQHGFLVLTGEFKVNLLVPG
jgi:acyl-coenzyme A thioesterase PaaI-like protein